MRTLILLLVLITANTTYSQNRMSLTYKDGKVITGYGKIYGKGAKFKSSKKGKYKKIDRSLIDKFTITIGKNDLNFTYIPLKKGKKPKLVELVYDGENINLYRIASRGPGTSSSAGNVNVSASVNVVRYYVSRENESYATMLRSGTVLGKSFEKRARKYFTDCNSLTSKLNTEGFKKGDIEKVIEYYDTKCQK